MSARTYSMLEPLGRVPSRYELVSSHLSWRATRGRALPLEAEAWHRTHGAEARLGDLPYETFADPDAHTYTTWVAERRARETTVASLFDADDPRRLEPEVRARVMRVLGPLRYAGHGLMMLAGYLGSLAPSGRLTIVFAFQAGDEMRRVHRCAERLHQLGEGSEALATVARRDWETSDVWRPLRTRIERALVTWNFDEAFAATQLAIKPALDLWCATRLHAFAHAHGDRALAGMLDSLALDHAWHRRVSDAFVRFVTESSSTGSSSTGSSSTGSSSMDSVNDAVARLERAKAEWDAPARDAVAHLDALLDGGGG